MFYIGLGLFALACFAFPPILFVALAIFAWWLMTNDN